MPEELRCAGCQAPCRPEDRFCSQCGRRDPASPATEAPTVSAVVGQSGEQATIPLRKASRPGSVQASDDVFETGSRFARRYLIERLLGAGAMGRVYLAIDTTIDEPIALKFISGAHRFDPSFLEQFKLELKLARRVRHRNVVASFHLGEDEERAYITQEYIESESLSALVARKGPLSETDGLGLIRQVLRGLKAAHDIGIVHRDVKAGNILVNKDGMAFITDFGLAFSEAQKTGHSVAGTAQYMAPELFDGTAATPSTDLYASGVLLFHVLTGTFPFFGKTFSDFRESHQHADPEAIPSALPISSTTRRLCGQMMARDPLERPQRAVDVLEVIESALAIEALTINTERPIALVADADERVRSAARQRLGQEGYHVETVATAQDAVSFAFSLTPSLVVLNSNLEGGRDIAMSAATTSLVSKVLPDHGGLGLCRLLQHDSRLKNVPVLVVTEEQHPGLKSAFMLMGAAEVIAKPFTADEFGAGLDRARQMAFTRAAEN